MSTNQVNDSGRKVLQFTSRIKNLVRVGELADAMIDIAESGAWRDYTFATGHHTWLEAEFDYFLIATNVRRDDCARVLAHNKRTKDLVPLMDRQAGPDKRRPLQQAATDWAQHDTLNVDLVQRARELGWIHPAKQGAAASVMSFTASPIPERARTQARHGVKQDELAARNRAARIPAKRRRELDKLAGQLRAELNDDERRYLAQHVASSPTSATSRNPGRSPKTTDNDLKRWRADVIQIGRKPTKLAQHWGVSRWTAARRLERLGA